jgi:hypothetical protein
MDKKNRKTLKKYFKKGCLPSEKEFGYLIDSMLNTIDEGFEKTKEEGLKISSLGKSDKLAGFYRDIEKKSPIWSIEFNDPGNCLVFKGRENTVLCLDPQGKVGINTDKPQAHLDVEGTIASKGRMGKYKDGKVPADGKPHTILEGLDGCHAFEIMAGAGGKEKSGQYALVHTFAVNTYNSKGSIADHQAHYGSRCNRIKLWWEGDPHNYCLKIKTSSCYGDGSAICYQITELWFDHFMKECRL